MKTLSILFVILLFVAPKLAAALGLFLVIGLFCGVLKLNITYTDFDKEKSTHF